MKRILFALSLIVCVLPSEAQLFGGDKERETAEGVENPFSGLFKSKQGAEAKSKKTKSGGISKYAVDGKRSGETTVRAVPVAYDGMAESEDAETGQGEAKSTLRHGKGMMRTHHRRSVKIFDTPDTSLTRQYAFRNIVLGEPLDAKAITDSTLPEGFNKVLTNLDFYDQGEDMRLIDVEGRQVTLAFDKRDTTLLTSISVDNINDLSYVKRLQAQIREQMGVPMMGYEVVRNYDGEGTGMREDYSTYEFVYRYRYAGRTYDFRLQQKGVKMKGKQVLHPYDFTATLLDGALNATMQQTIDADAPQKQEMEEERFYPTEGMKSEGGFVIETKILNRW